MKTSEKVFRALSAMEEAHRTLCDAYAEIPDGQLRLACIKAGEANDHARRAVRQLEETES